MDKKYIVLGNNLLMKRALTRKQAEKEAQKLTDKGIKGSYGSKLNTNVEGTSQVWAFLNKKGAN